MFKLLFRLAIAMGLVALFTSNGGKPAAKKKPAGESDKEADVPEGKTVE